MQPRPETKKKAWVGISNCAKSSLKDTINTISQQQLTHARHITPGFVHFNSDLNNPGEKTASPRSNSLVQGRVGATISVKSIWLGPWLSHHCVITTALVSTWSGPNSRCLWNQAECEVRRQQSSTLPGDALLWDSRGQSCRFHLKTLVPGINSQDEGNSRHSLSGHRGMKLGIESPAALTGGVSRMRKQCT